jgi:hypothetical protein
MSGPFGPFGSEAVVMTGIFKSVEFREHYCVRSQFGNADVLDGLEQTGLVIQ